MKTALMSPEELQPQTEAAQRVVTELDRMLLGRHELHQLVVAGVLSQGHILLEGLPGLGKTAMIHALGQILDLEFKRAQFTPDLMPSDLLGAHILQENEAGNREMVFQPGPVFCNILLADEINRASPKTQSALLEVMQERSVTLLGNTRPLPDPFFVLASQNPIELEGTYPLPEAQVDRFLFKANVTSVDVASLAEIIQKRRRGEPPKVEWKLGKDGLKALFAAMERMYMPDAVAQFIARLTAATHPGGAEATEAVTNYIQYGASPRAAIGMAEAARAWALLAGRPTVGFEDVHAIAASTLNHRLLLNHKARFDRVDVFEMIAELLKAVPAIDSNLPRTIQVKEMEA